MKKLHLFFIVAAGLMFAACGNNSDKQPKYKDASASIEDRVNDLMSRMTFEEKCMQISQYFTGTNDNSNNIGEAVAKVPAEVGSMIYFDKEIGLRNSVQKKAVEESRLGIPILFGYDVIHGFVTIYPIGLAQACSWDPSLTERAASMAAREARAGGIDWTFSPMIDVAHDPRWGRISEGFGEDPYTTARFAVAAVNGFQGDDLTDRKHVAACVKHFVGYGASEGGRDYVYTEIAPSTLWNMYIPPYEAAVKAGAASLMTSFNDINGTPATANDYLLRDVLKGRWGFKGLVVSDWADIDQMIGQGYAVDLKEATELAINAGTDLDMMSHAYDTHLKELVDEGKVSMKTIDDAVRRVLTLKFRLGLFENPYTPEMADSAKYLLADAKEAAQRLAEESIVLLKNEGNVLPLTAGKAKRIALIGPLADNRDDLMGNWHAHGSGDDVATIYEVMKKEMADAEVRYAQGCDIEGNTTNGYQSARSLAAWADVAVVCLGEKLSWSGENASMASISLKEGQERLLAEVKKTAKKVVVVLSNGRPLELPRVEKNADAMVEMWQLGTMGAYALTNILTGKVVPSGKLSVTFPYSVGQIPIYYNARRASRPDDQGRYKDVQEAPLYPFGHGLSYTTFEYGELKVSKTEFGRGDKLTATIDVKNTGEYDAKETVHFFIADPACRTLTRPVKELKYFDKKMIKKGETQTFTFEIDPERDFGHYDHDGHWFLEPGEYDVIVGNQTVKLTMK
ncbi:MAG: glycoside hydrolase family 3 C-terminal domain-containing protein [Prevotella sp.]|nr:glycoside hydrolase family 3 C-terminal domain-containing protein [Prevotella sp.]